MYSEKLKIIKKSLGSFYESNDELLFFCPKCNHHKRKLSVNISKNFFKCWVCDYKGKDITPLIKDRSLKTQWRELTQQVDISRFDEFFIDREKTEKEKEYLELPQHFSTLTTSKLSSIGKKAKGYLLSRGITEEQIYLYKIGFCHHGNYRNRIIVPSYDKDGELNYFIARSFSDDYLKYKNPPCAKDVIFNDIFIDWKKPIVLVEGFFDSLKYDNSIPILGSTLNTRTKLFTKIINNCSSVYLCLDKDAANKQSKIAKNLLDFGVKVYTIELYDYNDLGEVPSSLLDEYKKRASVVTREDYLIQRINNFGG